MTKQHSRKVIFFSLEGTTLRCSTNSLPVQCHQETACQTPMHCHVQDSKTHIPCSAETALEPCRADKHEKAFGSHRDGETAKNFDEVSAVADKKLKVVDGISSPQIDENWTKTQSHTRMFDSDGEKAAAAVKQNSFGPKIACVLPEYWCMSKQVTELVTFISALYQRVHFATPLPPTLQLMRR